MKLFEKYGARLLAMETNPKILEGKAKTMNAIIAFLLEDVLMQMYNDPESPAVICFRRDVTSDARMVILKPYEQNA